QLTGKGAAAYKGRPAWWRGTFSVPHIGQPLFLDATGLSKGLLYVNGNAAGRYFVSTHGGKGVPPQVRYYLPEPWLKPGEDNELLLFDEHGFAPGKCKLVYDAAG
ncbi:MAG: beta-galactosidase, partial [Planctomycetota bacterium]